MRLPYKGGCCLTKEGGSGFSVRLETKAPVADGFCIGGLAIRGQDAGAVAVRCYLLLVPVPLSRAINQVRD